MGLLGNFLGNALGMQSAEEYTQSVEAASRLRDLQNRNQSLKDEAKVPVTNVDTDQVGGLKIPDTLDLGPLTQPPLKDIPKPPKPPVDQEGGVADGISEADRAMGRNAQGGGVQIQTEDGSLASGPNLIRTDPSIPANENIFNNQIPVPEFKGTETARALFSKGVVSDKRV